MNTNDKALLPTREEVIAFLNGSGELEGLWFGDSDTSNPKPRYWWRKYLPILSAPADVAIVRGNLPPSSYDEAIQMIETVFKERNYPCSPKAAARCGYEAARRILSQPISAMPDHIHDTTETIDRPIKNFCADCGKRNHAGSIHTCSPQVAMPEDAREAEIKRLHIELAGEKLRADQGWQRYESANKMCQIQQSEIAALSSRAEPEGEIRIVTNEAGECVTVTRTDEDHHILSVIWERTKPTVRSIYEAMRNNAAPAYTKQDKEG